MAKFAKNASRATNDAHTDDERTTFDIVPVEVTVRMSFAAAKFPNENGNVTLKKGYAEIIAADGIDLDKVNAFFGASGNGRFVCYAKDGAVQEAKPAKPAKAAKPAKGKAKAEPETPEITPEMMQMFMAMMAKANK